MAIEQLIRVAIEQGASDIHITVASPPLLRINGRIHRLGEEKIIPETADAMAREVINSEALWQKYQEKGEIDVSYSQAGLGRFRVNVYKQRGSSCMALRVVSLKIPTIDEMHLPEVLKTIASKRRGLVLVTGPTGSGKSTTLAAMIDYINTTRDENIITIEDPIEFLHKHNKSVVNQREVGGDTQSFANALRAALRQDPDIIMVGEMRDLETISTAITAAETGHLVFSTLHTIGAASTIDRIIDVFPPHQQQQIKVQLSNVLEAVISQQLMPTADGNARVAAFEIMTATPAVRNLLREGKSHQLNTIIQTSQSAGMELMDNSMKRLYRNGQISLETLKKYAIDFDILSKQMGMGGPRL